MEEESSSAIALRPELEAPRYGIVGAGGSDVGTRHDHNEDRWAVQGISGGALLVVCDGMGGMGRGDQASTFALTRLIEVIGRGHVPPLEAASAAIRQVDRELVTALGDDGSGRQPGSTCALVQIAEGVAYVSWVGDSAVMLIRDGRVFAQSRPHRLVQDLIDKGVMSPEEARTSPMARFLARSLGGRSPTEAAVEPDSLRWRLMPGDTIVLCSDGLTDMLRPPEIAAIVQRGLSEAQTVDALIELALERQADDNVTVIVARCVHAAVAGEDELLAPAWDYFPGEDDEEEPDYDADLPNRLSSAEVPRPPVPARNPMVLAAAAVFGFGALTLVLTATWAWWLLG